MISEKAQEVLDILEEVRLDGNTVKYLEEDQQGRKWLPVVNIINGWVEGVPDEFKALLWRLSLTIHGNLISPLGDNNKYYYELKRNGYMLKVEESDSFGPLVCSIKCPKADWGVCYG